MKRTCQLAILFVLSGLVHCGCGGNPKPNPKELEGKWVGQEVGGVTGECRLDISESRMKFQGARPNESYSASLTLDQTASPRQALIQIRECSFPQYVNKSARAIYKLEANTLTIAATEPGVEVTPTGFQRSATNQIRVFVFTKQ